MPAPQHVAITNYVWADDEWWSPSWLALNSRIVLGGIDLDPASCRKANKIIMAKKIYTCKDNGLEQAWSGTVFLNPPSKRGNPTARVKLWTAKLEEEYLAGNVTAAILVVKSNLGYNWYEDLYRKYWVCHMRERTVFTSPAREEQARAKKGTSVFYMGPRPKLFRALFREFGRVIPPENTP